MIAMQNAILFFLLAIGIVVLIQKFTEREHFKERFLGSLAMAVPVGFVSVFMSSVLFALGVIVSHLVFDTPMEIFYYLFIAAMVQWVFYIVAFVVVFAGASDFTHLNKWKRAFRQIVWVVIISVPLTIFIGNITIEREKTLGEKQKVEWQQLLEKEMQPYQVEYQIYSYYEIEKERTYTLNVQEPEVSGESPSSVSIQVIFNLEKGIQNKKEVETQIKKIKE